LVREEENNKWGSQIVTEPVYRQLSRVLREEISSGRYAAGDRFPSERRIATEYRVSRATANKVISNLVAEGVLRFQKGIGTFVQTVGLSATLRDMRSFTSHAENVGLEPATRVLHLKTLASSALPSEVRSGLELSDDAREKVYFLKRLRLADGEPVILEYRWIRAALAPGLTRKDLEGSLYALLEDRFGIVMAGEEQRIRAEKLSKRVAGEYGLPAGRSVLVVEGVGYSREEEPVWYQVLCYDGQRYELRNQIGNRNAGKGSVLQLRPVTRNASAR
jgi:DNA-binding GntR family transcriptional regulator